MIENKGNHKQITIRLSQDDYDTIINKSQKYNMSINRYFIHTALGHKDSHRLNAFKISQILCELNLDADTIECITTRDRIKERIAGAWQYLK